MLDAHSQGPQSRVCLGLQHSPVGLATLLCVRHPWQFVNTSLPRSSGTSLSDMHVLQV